MFGLSFACFVMAASANFAAAERDDGHRLETMLKTVKIPHVLQRIYKEWESSTKYDTRTVKSVPVQVTDLDDGSLLMTAIYLESKSIVIRKVELWMEFPDVRRRSRVRHVEQSISVSPADGTCGSVIRTRKKPQFREILELNFNITSFYMSCSGEGTKRLHLKLKMTAKSFEAAEDLATTRMDAFLIVTLYQRDLDFSLKSVSSMKAPSRRHKRSVDETGRTAPAAGEREASGRLENAGSARHQGAAYERRTITSTENAKVVVENAGGLGNRKRANHGKEGTATCAEIEKEASGQVENAPLTTAQNRTADERRSAIEEKAFDKDENVPAVTSNETGFKITTVKSKLKMDFNQLENASSNRGRRMVDERRRRRMWTRSRRKCGLHRWYISFEDMGWNWVVAPPNGFAANRCGGRCSFPLSAFMNSTNHAVVQTLMNSVFGKPNNACCASKDMAPLTMLILGDNGSVAMKNYPDMIVTSCACL